MKSQHVGADVDDSRSDAASIKISTLSLQSGSAFNISGDFQDPREVVQHSCDFDSIILVLQHLKCADGGERFQPESHITERQREKAMERDAEVQRLKEQMSSTVEENAKISIQQECCEMLKAIGAPWNWLHNFASHNCHYKSYNFLETESIRSDVTPNDERDDVEVMVKI